MDRSLLGAATPQAWIGASPRIRIKLSAWTRERLPLIATSSFDSAFSPRAEGLLRPTGDIHPVPRTVACDL